MNTIAYLLQQGLDSLTQAGVPNPKEDAEWLLSHTLKCTPFELYLSPQNSISENEQAQWDTLLQRRIKREPLQYIVGYTEFWGLVIEVTPDVLIPRPETELLVEEAIFLAPRNILDIGTGSGCISVTLAKKFPLAKITSVDISPKALMVAKRNAATHGVGSQITFVEADLFPENLEEHSLDLIISNPPYIPESEMAGLQEEVRDFEPHLALVGGDSGLDLIEKILQQAFRYLKPNGVILLEVGENQAEAIKTMVPEGRNVTIRKDYQGVERIVKIS